VPLVTLEGRRVDEPAIADEEPPPRTPSATVATNEAPPAVSAPPSTLQAARALASSGLQKLDVGDAAGALVEFERAYALVQVPTILLMIGRAQLKLGRNADARRSFEQVAKWPSTPSEPAVFAHARQQAATLLAGARP
jgi:TolA-binding protein